MKKDIEKYELIEKYLLNQLPEDEYQKVKQKILYDSDFASEVKQHEAVMNFINESTFAEIKSSIKDIHSQHSKSFFKRISGKNKLLYILAGLAIVSLPILFSLLQTKNIEETKNTIVQSATSTDLSNIEIVTDTNANKVPVSEAQPAKIKENKKKDILSIETNPIKVPTVVEEVFLPENKDLVRNEIAEEKALTILKEDQKTQLATLETEKTDPFDCSKIKIVTEVFVDNSCIREATGKITIDADKIEGGVPPYKISIDNKKTYKLELGFNQLKPGSYTLWLSDNNNCIENIGTYWVSTDDCNSENNEYIFAPDKQERWKIPQVKDAVQIEIYNQQGIIVYIADLDETLPCYWDGLSGNGIAQPMGVYSYIIKTQTQEVSTGNVTIVR